MGGAGRFGFSRLASWPSMSPGFDAHCRSGLGAAMKMGSGQKPGEPGVLEYQLDFPTGICQTGIEAFGSPRECSILWKTEPAAVIRQLSFMRIARTLRGMKTGSWGIPTDSSPKL